MSRFGIIFSILTAMAVLPLSVADTGATGSCVATPYTFNDVVRDLVPNRGGYEALKEIATVIDRAAVKVSGNAETDEFAAYLKKMMGQFDFLKLYRSKYCMPLQDGFCGVRIRGCAVDNGYSLTLVTSPENTCPMKRMWDFTAEYSLKRVENNIAGGQSFIVSAASTTASKRYSHKSIMTFVESIIKVFDPTNMTSLKAPESPVYKNIEGPQRNIVNDFYRSFPNISEMFYRYVDMRSLAWLESYRGETYTNFELHYGYKMTNLAADFPVLANSLEEVRGLYRITMDVKNESGNTVLYLVFDSSDEIFSMSFFTRNGKFIPKDAAGKPVFSEEFSPTALKDCTLRATLGMVHDVHGLVFTTPSATVDFTYHDWPIGGSWRIKLIEATPTTISGSYYNFIPLWLINVFMPGNMEQLIQDFTKLLINGNGGQGASVSLEWDTRDPDNVMLKYKAIGEFMDNMFLRYGLNVWSKKTFGDNKLHDDVQKLKERLIAAFMTDLKNLDLNSPDIHR